MQTFVPYPDLVATARALDDRRLGKQRVETMQILRALTREKYGWKHHPAVKMWRGFEPALVVYGRVICEEWRRRGHADTCEATILADAAEAGIDVTKTVLRRRGGVVPRGVAFPPWWGDDAVHESHRASLLRKDPDHYRPIFGDGTPDDLPYVWPTNASPAGDGRGAR
ncbi:MAG TPA: MSMEG_6728 family protein [Acidimicrobiales bacterium]|nr:MSMEG_6728 family protein [Acidimicrobiales bacterium]